MKDSLSNWSVVKYYGVLFLFYFVAHGGILLIPNAIYWDDWVLFEVDSEIIRDTFKQAGSMFNITSYVHIFFLSIGPWFYKFLTFVMMFGAGVALNVILKKNELVEIGARFLIVLFFLVLPFYWARVALIDMVYTISVFLFFLAWALIDRYRWISLALFFLSFNTNSLLVFYALPIAELFYRCHGLNFNLKVVLGFIFDKLDYFLLPFVYYAIKWFYFRPTGVYGGYNEHFTIAGLFKSPLSMFAEFLFYIKVNFNQISIYLVVLILMFILYNFFKRSGIKDYFHGDRRYVFLLLGVTIFYIGAFPYFILGHVPTFLEWTSRHQLLLPLGSSIVIVACVGCLNSNKRPFALSIILAISLAMNIFAYRDFYIDWQKQRQIISLFRSSDVVRDSQLIVIKDKALNYNAINRTYRSYEWNGILFQAFGDEKRLGINDSDFIHFLNGDFPGIYFSHGDFYRMGVFSFDSPVRVAEVEIFRLNHDGLNDKFPMYPEFGISVKSKEALNLVGVY